MNLVLFNKLSASRINGTRFLERELKIEETNKKILEQNNTHLYLHIGYNM